MDTRQRESTPPSPLAGPIYGGYVVSLAICLLGNLAIRIAGQAGEWLPPWAAVAVAIATAGPLVVTAGLFWRMLDRGLDEMLRQVVLEGMAFALVLYVPLAGLYVNLRTAGAWTPRLDPPDILLTPALLVAIGIAFAWRRYR